MLKVYYKHSIQAPFREPEWVRVRELFFDRFAPKKGEELAIKEESPLEYMPFIAEEFYKATGLRLHDLLEFTLWIKKGSYFHGYWLSEAKSRSAPFDWGTVTQVAPAKAQQVSPESYRRAEGPTVGSSEPSLGATAAPTQETPTEEPLVEETPTEEPPVEETPAEEPPVEEAPVAGPSRSDTPAPREDGGAGDGQSWAEQVETSSEAEFRWARPLKHPHSQSRRLGDGAGTSLSPPRHGGETRLRREALRACGEAAATSG